VVPVVLDGDGVYDGLLLEQVKVTVWSEISSFFYNSDGVRLKLSAVPV
jgi:hypothetical protein